MFKSVLFRKPYTILKTKGGFDGDSRQNTISAVPSAITEGSIMLAINFAIRVRSRACLLVPEMRTFFISVHGTYIS